MNNSSKRQTLADITGMLDGVAGLTVVERKNGLVIDIAIDSAQASIALQGAQVLRWKPAGHEDVIWCSSMSNFGGGKPIRGGIPVCWPWFGPHASDATKPQHGYARNIAWELVDVTDLDDNGGHVVLTLRLPIDASERHMGAANLDALMFIDVGAALSLRLETENTGTTSETITEALHTYFRIGDISRVRIDGLDGATYRDNADGGKPKQQSGTMTIPRETVALFDTAPAVANLIDPALKRCIAILRDSDSRSTIVWNPGATAAGIADIHKGGEAQFVCVESGNIGASSVTIAPGDTHSCGVSYRVEKL